MGFGVAVLWNGVAVLRNSQCNVLRQKHKGKTIRNAIDTKECLAKAVVPGMFCRGAGGHPGGSTTLWGFAVWGSGRLRLVRPAAHRGSIEAHRGRPRYGPRQLFIVKTMVFETSHMPSRLHRGSSRPASTAFSL